MSIGGYPQPLSLALNASGPADDLGRAGAASERSARGDAEIHGLMTPTRSQAELEAKSFWARPAVLSLLLGACGSPAVDQIELSGPAIGPGVTFRGRESRLSMRVV